MKYVIKSEKFMAAVDSFGAELCSVKDANGCEYIWTAEDVWKRHAPLLFPFVCNTKSKKYTVNGREYALSNHGFARDSEFELADSGDGYVILKLVSSPETKAKYPFDFELLAGYKISGNKLAVTLTVKNTGNEEMPFFIGGHPGFLCPFESDTEGTLEDYDVVYEKPETIIQELDSGDNTVLENGTAVSLTRKLFKNDVFLKDKPASSWVALVNRKNGRRIKVSYDNSGCIAVWSPYDDRANFVCLEPWAAAPVYCCDTEELTQMPHARRIAAGESYEFGFEIEID
ncbi:MAG: aldose 1-epimerase family protein [Ruminococcus sp.]|nr:aldose 1-epimerase family protein [Ruminococcus sp.]